MKKKIFLILCCVLPLAMLAGCSTSEIMERLPHSDPEESASTEHKERVFMDKMNGVLTGFDGTDITVSVDDTYYTFDASGATVECARGLIAGDEISIIYEGQLSGADTSQLKVLKIVDELHPQNALQEEILAASLVGLTENTVTFTDEQGRTYTCVSAGAVQYFQNGIVSGLPVTVHYLGTFPQTESGNAEPVPAPLVKILSISDSEPIAAPDLTKIIPAVSSAGSAEQDESAASVDGAAVVSGEGAWNAAGAEAEGAWNAAGAEAEGALNAAGEEAGGAGNTEGAGAEAEGPEDSASGNKAAGRSAAPVSSFPKLRGKLQGLSLNQLLFIPDGMSEPVRIDLGSLPCYFPGGFMIGTGADFYYAGDISEYGISGVIMLYAAGDDPGSLKETRVTSTVSGVVIGHTADTVTVRTMDGAQVMIREQSSGGGSVSREVGDEISAAVNPAVSGRSNILEGR